MCQPASNKSILSKCFFIEGLREIKLSVSPRAGQKMLISSAVASNRPTEALASVISLAFVVYST